MKERIYITFFDQSKKSYATGSQIDLTFPLLAQIVPDSLIVAVTAALNNEIVINRTGHIATVLVGIPVFTEWAIKNHAARLFYSMLKKTDYPGYLYMIENVPVGCKATVVLPRETKNYILNGRKFKLTKNNGKRLVEIGSGKYTLSGDYEKDISN